MISFNAMIAAISQIAKAYTRSVEWKILTEKTRWVERLEDEHDELEHKITKLRDSRDPRDHALADRVRTQLTRKHKYLSVIRSEDHSVANGEPDTNNGGGLHAKK